MKYKTSKYLGAYKWQALAKQKSGWAFSVEIFQLSIICCKSFDVVKLRGIDNHP